MSPPTKEQWNALTAKERVDILSKTRMDCRSLSGITKGYLFDGGAEDATKCGAFNPSIVGGEQPTVIFRGEPTETTWGGHFLEQKAVPMVAKVTIKNSFAVLQERPKPIESGMPLPCRPEDWRLFSHLGKTYVNFTNYFYFNSGWEQKVAQARTCLGILEHDRISFIREMECPFIKTRKEEKNWCFFSENNELFCVYSVSPFIVMHCDSTGRVLRIKEETNPLPRHGNRFMANSTNPILVNMPKLGNVFLMFVHQFFTPLGKSRNRTYFQHAFVFSPEDHKPLGFTPMPITGGGQHIRGRHNGVVYFSGAIEDGENIVITAGEGDSHSSQYSIPKLEIVENLQKL